MPLAADACKLQAGAILRTLNSPPPRATRWTTNVCKKCADMASTNAVGKTAATDCGCPINTFSSTDTPDTTGCQPCPVNSYRNLVSVVAGETVDLKGAAGIAEEQAVLWRALQQPRLQCLCRAAARLAGEAVGRQR